MFHPPTPPLTTLTLFHPSTPSPHLIYGNPEEMNNAATILELFAQLNIPVPQSADLQNGRKRVYVQVGDVWCVGEGKGEARSVQQAIHEVVGEITVPHSCVKGRIAK